MPAPIHSRVASAPAAEEKPAEETPVAEEKPAEDAPAAEEQPAEEAPAADEKPAEEAKVAEEKPAEEAPAAEEQRAEEAPVAEEKPAEETPADEPVCFSRNSNHLLYLTYCVPWLWPEYSFPLHQLWRASCKHRIACASFVLGFHGPAPRKRGFASACAHKLAYVCRASGQKVTFPLAVTGSALIADLLVELFAAVLF